MKRVQMLGILNPRDVLSLLISSMSKWGFKTYFARCSRKTLIACPLSSLHLNCSSSPKCCLQHLRSVWVAEHSPFLVYVRVTIGKMGRYYVDKTPLRISSARAVHIWTNKPALRFLSEASPRIFVCTLTQIKHHRAWLTIFTKNILIKYNRFFSWPSRNCFICVQKSVLKTDSVKESYRMSEGTFVLVGSCEHKKDSLK